MKRDDILQLAELARLRLTDEELSQYAEDLTKVVEYVEQLNEVDVTGVEPTSQVTGLMNVLRDDEGDETRGMGTKELEALAPEFQDGYVKVPGVFSSTDE